MIEIMLWKFFWTYQKNHAIENHTMENHVRQGLTVPSYSLGRWVLHSPT